MFKDILKQMFSGLLDYSKKKSDIEALGFYIAYLILGIAIIATAGLLAGVVTHQTVPSISKFAEYTATILYPTYMSYKIIKAKDGFKNKVNITLLILTLIISALSGCSLGLIPTAVLTAIGEKSSENNSEPEKNE